MSKYHIYGLGNALVDKEFEVDDQFFTDLNIEKGQMTLIDQDQLFERLTVLSEKYGLKKRACGGSAANTIIGASYLGAKTYYSCNVADDESGRFYTEDMQAAGVDTNISEQRASTDLGVTGKCLVMVTPDAERTMNTYLGITADLSAEQINQDAIKESEYVYLEGYLVTSDVSRAAAIKVREFAQANNVKTALTFSDPAMVQFFKDQMNEMLGDKVDMLFCNEEEALLFSGQDNLNDAVEYLKTRANQFAITLGSKGAIAFDGQQMHDIAANEAKAVDTNGAGDMFAGAFMYAITHGHDFAAAGRLASLASSQVVAKFGPRLEPSDHETLKAVL